MSLWSKVIRTKIKVMITAPEYIRRKINDKQSTRKTNKTKATNTSKETKFKNMYIWWFENPR